MTTKVSLIADSSVTGATINDLTITTDDIANNTVTTSKIDFGTALVPLGGIIMWSGTTIPTGWALCNGSNGTPNLQDRFIVGAGSRYAVAATGGSANATLVSHSHTATSSVSDPGHLHRVPNSGSAGANISAFGQGGVNNQGTYNTFSGVTGITVSTSITATGSSATNANLPPYYALAFIMRVL